MGVLTRTYKICRTATEEGNAGGLTCIFDQLFSVTCSSILQINDCCCSPPKQHASSSSSSSPLSLFSNSGISQKASLLTPLVIPLPSSPQAGASVGGVELRRLPETPAGAGRLLRADAGSERLRRPQGSEREAQERREQHKGGRDRGGRRICDRMWFLWACRTYFEHDRNTPRVQVCLSSVRWGGRRAKPPSSRRWALRGLCLAGKPHPRTGSGPLLHPLLSASEQNVSFWRKLSPSSWIRLHALKNFSTRLQNRSVCFLFLTPWVCLNFSSCVTALCPHSPRVTLCQLGLRVCRSHQTSRQAASLGLERRDRGPPVKCVEGGGGVWIPSPFRSGLLWELPVSVYTLTVCSSRHEFIQVCRGGGGGYTGKQVEGWQEVKEYWGGKQRNDCVWVRGLHISKLLWISSSWWEAGRSRGFHAKTLTHSQKPVLRWFTVEPGAPDALRLIRCFMLRFFKHEFAQEKHKGDRTAAEKYQGLKRILVIHGM